VIGCGMVGTAPAYYDPVNGVRAYTLAEGTEFDGTANQTGIDTKYTTLNNHLALNAARSVNSLWIDSPGAGNVVNLGASGAFNLTLTSGRLTLTGSDDFTVTRSGSSTGVLTRDLFGTLFLGVDTGRTLTMSVPIASASGGLAKDGAGTLVLNATNTFWGTLSINEGTVRYAPGGTGDLNGGCPINIWNNGLLDFAGDVDAVGTVTIYSGGITNSASYGALTYGALTMGGGPAGSSTYVNSGTGTNKLSGTVTFNSANDPNTATIAGTLDLNGGTRTFTANNSYALGAAVDMDIPATIVGGVGYGITKNGAGVLQLRGPNTFDGVIAAPDNSGTIIVKHPQALGAPTVGRTLSIGNNDTMALDGSTGNIVVPPLYTNLFLNGAGDYQIGTVRGALTSVSGSNTVSCPITLTGNNVYIASLQAGGSLVLPGNISGAFDLTANGDGNTVLGGAIATTAKPLNKNGDGTLTLSGTGANTFSGTTSVNDGKLLLAKASGLAGVNAIAGGAINVNDGGILQYAASSANPDMIGTGTLTINQTGRLDFNGASDGIGLLSINSAGAITDSTPVTNSASGGNLAVNGLTIQVAHGFLTRIDTGTGTLTLSNNVTFNAATTGRALISGKLSLANATRTFTVNSGIHSNYDLSIDAVIDGTAGTGLTKAGGGLLRLGGANTAFNGVLPVTAGTVVLGNSQALGVPSVVRTNIVSSGCTLALDGVDIYDPNNRIALNLTGTGDQRNGGAASGALTSLSGSNTVPCAIILAGGTQISSLKAGGTLVLSGTVTGGGNALTVAGAGVTALAGVNGAIPTASSITVSQNATLSLQNTAAANKADRITNTCPITLVGGALRFSHDGGAANFTEALGALTISAGSNAVFASQAAGGMTSALVFASMTWAAGGTVNFTGEELGVNPRNRIFITGQADGMIGPWAFINGTNLAFYSASAGVYAGASTEANIAARGNDAGNDTIPHDETKSAVINLPGNDGPIKLQELWTNRVLEVRQETAYAATVTMTNDTGTKALQTSRLMIKEGQEALTIGEVENSGTLTALWSGGALSLENRNASKTLTVNAAIANNSAASSLAKFGPGPVLLTGSNSYSGATLVSEGTLEFNSSRAQKLSGVISGAGTLVKSGTNQLHLAGTNTFTGPLYVNAGIVRPDQNSAFGSAAAGTFIASGAMLDVGCDPTVGGTRYDSLNLGAEEFTVSGSGVGGMGVIVNNGTSNQMSSVQKVLLSDDATFGGKNRWDIRTGYLFMNDHTLTKTGGCEIAYPSIPIYPGTGRMIVNQGLLRFESGTLLNGSASNSVTVNSGAKLELYNLSPFVPVWSLILNEGSFFQGSGTLFTTNMNHWAGPVKLNGRTFMNGSVGSIHWSIDGDVSGTGTLVKAGNSSATLWLNNTNNTYEGGTIVSNGTLYAKYPASLPGYNDGRLTIGGDGFLAFHASDGTFGFTASQVRDLCTASTFKINTSGLNIDTSMNNLSLGNDLTKPMALIKQGTNTLTLAGNTNTYGGITYVNGGALRYSSPVGTNNTMKLFLGYNVTNAAAVIQEGGLSDVGSTINGALTLAVGHGGTGSYGYYRKNGGTLTTGWLAVPGDNGYNGVFEQYSGDTYVVGSGSWLIMGWVNVNNGASVINVFGGTLRNSALGNEISMNHNASRNSFNMINLLGPTAFLDANSTRSLRLATAGTNLASVVNLNAGVITATRVYAGVTSVPSLFNFNGGTLRASASRSDFLQGLTATTVYPIRRRQN
jgi:autotransporter-associated beta strand protein